TCPALTPSVISAAVEFSDVVTLMAPPVVVPETSRINDFWREDKFVVAPLSVMLPPAPAPPTPASVPPSAGNDIGPAIATQPASGSMLRPEPPGAATLIREKLRLVTSIPPSPLFLTVM